MEEEDSVAVRCLLLGWVGWLAPSTAARRHEARQHGASTSPSFPATALVQRHGIQEGERDRSSNH